MVKKTLSLSSETIKRSISLLEKSSPLAQLYGSLLAYRGLDEHWDSAVVREWTHSVSYVAENPRR